MGKRACAGGAASRCGYSREAEGVVLRRRAHPCAQEKQPKPLSRRLLEKAGGERHGRALGAGAKGAIPLARDLTNQ